MGLTIHWELSAPSTWSIERCAEALEKARQFALTLSPVEVFPVTTLRSKAEVEAAKVDARRSLYNKYEPGSSRCDSAMQYVGFDVNVGDGSEWGTFALASFARCVWNADDLDDSKRELYIPYWEQVLTGKNLGKVGKESLKEFRAICKRYNMISQKPVKKSEGSPWCFHRNTAILYHITTKRYHHLLEVREVKGEYASHRRGYGPSRARMLIHDSARNISYPFLFRGSVEDVRKMVETPEFKADMLAMVAGRKVIYPGERWMLNQFAKTQYASDPSCGGMPNFIQAHLTIVAILDFIKTLGVKVEVYDEGGYYDDRDVDKLAKECGDWNVSIAAMVGALKDIAGGDNVVAPITSFSDFEHLEMKGQTGITGEYLAKMREVAKAIAAAHPHVEAE